MNGCTFPSSRRTASLRSRGVAMVVENSDQTNASCCLVSSIDRPMTISRRRFVKASCELAVRFVLAQKLCSSFRAIQAALETSAAARRVHIVRFR